MRFRRIRRSSRVKTRQRGDPVEYNARREFLQLPWQPRDRQAARESRHHKGVKRTGSSPLPPPIPISTFFAMLGSDDIETAAKTPITAAVMIMRT
jgi:hypothetical protein